ncbi:aurora kinase A [Amia ocellicauda]|uniref:aurora kinase A n=1 Tax=Amia ocellicauda TaxID=2972642 RepID=UPI003463F628
MSKIQLTLPVKATIITGMCQGLTYLHQKRIVHQDLKPDNIMIEYGSNRPVLIDFGVAKILYAGGISTAPNIGNEAYAPIEVLRGSLRGKHSEFWAMGKIVAELLLEIRLEIERYRTWDLSKQLEGSPYLEPLTKMLNDNYHLRASMDVVVGSLVKAGESLSLEQKPKPTQEKAP